MSNAFDSFDDKTLYAAAFPRARKTLAQVGAALLDNCPISDRQVLLPRIVEEVWDRASAFISTARIPASERNAAFFAINGELRRHGMLCDFERDMAAGLRAILDLRLERGLISLHDVAAAARRVA